MVNCIQASISIKEDQIGQSITKSQHILKSGLWKPNQSIYQVVTIYVRCHKSLSICYVSKRWTCSSGSLLQIGHLVSSRQAPIATKKRTLFITHENFPVNKETYSSSINLAKVCSPRLWALVRCVLLWNILWCFNLGCVITGRGWKGQWRARKTLGLIQLLALRVRQSSAEYWAWLEWTSYKSLRNKTDVKTQQIYFTSDFSLEATRKMWKMKFKTQWTSTAKYYTAD